MYQRKKKNFLVKFFKRFAKRAPILFRRQQKKVARFFRVFKKSFLNPIGTYISEKYSKIKNPILLTRIATIAIVIAMIGGFSYRVFATPPTSPYTAGETLNPTCAPGDANCTVTTSGASGSGTTGYIPKWTGSSTLGDSIIKDTGSRIEIGGDPDAGVTGGALVVKGNILPGSLTANVSSYTLGDFSIAWGGVHTDYVRGSGGMFNVTGSLSKAIFSDNDTAGLGVVIKSHGTQVAQFGDGTNPYVGIGTTTLNHTLEVNGSAQITVTPGRYVEISSIDHGSGIGVMLSGNSSDVIGISSFNTYLNQGKIYLYGYSSIAGGEDPIRGDFLFRNEYTSTDLMYLSPTGDLGIGTITPGYKLDTAGSSRFTGSVQASNFYDSVGTFNANLANGIGNVNVANGDNEGRGIVAGYSGGSYSGIGYNIRHTTTTDAYEAPGTDTASYLRFESGGFNFLGASSGSAGRTLALSSLMSIQNDGDVYIPGNLGIGDSSPTEKLVIAGNIIPTTGDGYNLGSSTKYWNTVHTGIVRGSGGGFYLTSSDSLKTATLADSGVNGNGVIIQSRGVDVVQFGNGTNPYVGIGTSTPSSKLDITTNALGTTQTITSGLALVNTTAATVGAQQISPAIRWSGSGWKTDATAGSQAVDFRSYVVPVEGSANPTGYLTFESAVNGGSYSANQLVLTTGGNVGIGTADPGVKLDIVGDVRISGGVLSANPLYTGAGLDGFGAIYGTTNGNGGGHIYLYQDNHATLPYGVQIADGSGAIINTTFYNSKVGIGTTDPSYKLDVTTDSASSYAGSFTNTGDDANRYGLRIQAGKDDGSAGTLIDFFDGDGTQITGNITYSSGVVAYNTTSDERLKQNIVETALSIETLNQIKIHDFTWRSDSTNKINHGVIAQELEQIYPDAVTVPTDPSRYYGVDYSKLTPLIIKSIQDQQAQIEDLKIQIAGISGVLTPQSSVLAMMNEFFSSVVTQVSGGIGYLKNITVETLKIGSPEKRTGITLFDEVTGSPYCISIANGEQKISQGECSVVSAPSESEDSGGAPIDTSGDTGGAGDSSIEVIPILPVDENNSEVPTDPKDASNSSDASSSTDQSTVTTEQQVTENNQEVSSEQQPAETSVDQTQELSF